MSSTRKFGVTTNLSGLSQGIVVNSINTNNTTQTAQARDSTGKIIDIATYSKDKEITIDGLYINDGLDIGSVVTVNDKNYYVISKSRTESNTAFQTASLVARLYPEQGSITPPEPVDDNPPLTFKALETAGLQLYNYGSPSAINIMYRKNSGSWFPYILGDNILLNEGEKVSFSGVNDHFSKDSNNYYKFIMAGKLSASGNVQSLISYSNDCSNNCFTNLFNGCSSLVSAPDLPATQLADGCYKTMFGGCTSLKSAPALPAIQLKTSCYSNMFNGCSDLITAPALPASTLAIDCYNYMFANCTSLTDAPYLPAKTLAITCYNSMFYNCTSLSSISVGFTNWNQTYSTLNWVLNVAQTGTFTKPASLSEAYGDNRIPDNWSVVNQ